MRGNTGLFGDLLGCTVCWTRGDRCGSVSVGELCVVKTGAVMVGAYFGCGNHFCGYEK